MAIRRPCSIEATKMKIEHIPNMIVIGNTSTCKTTRFFIVKKNKKIYVKKKKTGLILTLYKMMQTANYVQREFNRILKKKLQESTFLPLEESYEP